VAVLVGLGPAAILTPIALSRAGVERGLIFGVAVATGVWAPILLTTVASGAAAPLMGAAAEGWTTSDLKAMRRKGWQVVSGLKVRPQDDIDHVAVGPPGVFVVETKWSAWPWPFNGDGGFMGEQLRAAVRQAEQHAVHVTGFFARARQGAPVKAAVVLYSPTAPDADGPEWFDSNGVTVIRGGAFRRWLAAQTDVQLQPADIERIDLALDAQAISFDARLAAEGKMAPLTLSQLAWNWLFLPAFGLVAAMYTFVGLASFHRLWAIVVGETVAVLVGLALSRISQLKRVAWVWTIWALLILVLVAVVAIVASAR
jgi:hypothetical protein